MLEMTVEEGMYFFESIPKIYRKLKTLYDVGLGYVKIGIIATIAPHIFCCGIPMLLAVIGLIAPDG